MKELKDLLSVPHRETEHKSERSEHIQNFTDAINRDRVGTKYKPMTARSIAIRLGDLKSNSELYMFFRECENYQGPFSKRFFGGFKEQSWKL